MVLKMKIMRIIIIVTIILAMIGVIIPFIFRPFVIVTSVLYYT